MGFPITNLHAHLQFIISSDSELVACMTELGHGIVLNSRQKSPRVYLLLLSSCDKWQQGAGEALGNAAGGMRNEREFRGQMGKVMHKKLKQTGKPTKQKPNQKKANTPTLFFSNSYKLGL